MGADTTAPLGKQVLCLGLPRTTRVMATPRLKYPTPFLSLDTEYISDIL